MELPETPHIQLADLKPKMRLEGKVTKIEMFGAFVDVGVGVPGLVHISMLRQGHVNRVEDAVQEGQTVEVWVHRVEPASGRLELTMIRPLLVEWKELKPGLRLKGKVMRLEKFGAFVDVGAEKAGLVHVSEMSSGYVSDPAEVVKVGNEIDVTVLDVDRKKRQIRLSMKVPEVEAVEEPEAEAEGPLPTAMELALRQAMEKTGAGKSREAMAGPGGHRDRKTQEEIISRTLQTRARSTSSD